MHEDGIVRPKALHLRCGDAVVVGMGLAVALGSIFSREITFLLLGQ